MQEIVAHANKAKAGRGWSATGSPFDSHATSGGACDADRDGDGGGRGASRNRD